MKAFRIVLACAALLAVAAPTLAADDPHMAARYFLGTWTCAGTTWTYTPFLGDPTWIRNAYGDPAKPGGSAIIGYAVGLKKYVYRDFHADGAYADISSDGPVDGVWTWTGPYYPAEGGVLAGRITYTVTSPSRFERGFESLVDGSYKKMGGDVCLKA